MKSITFPTKIETNLKAENAAQFVIEPCYPGYGVTLGNSLRRVLFSSLPGAAIYAVKIKGAPHEFSTLPYIKEDMVEIILNLKTVRLKLLDVEETKATLEIKGEKDVTAAYIKHGNELEIATPEIHIATLTDPKASLEMEFYIKSGLGYLPVEAREKEKLDLGTIALDAIYTPVKKVNFKVENVRVEQMTNFDKLILDIETDGSIKPEEAFKKAAFILSEHYKVFYEEMDKVMEKSKEKEEKKKTKTSKKT